MALLESRMTDEIAALVRRHGGEPISAPAVREVSRLEQMGDITAALAAGGYAAVVFLTGAGVSALMQEADRRGELARAVGALQSAIVACRGPKPLAVLKRFGVAPAVTTAKPHTSAELLAALDGVNLRDARVLLVHYGEMNADIAEALRARGARLDEACPYEWALPDDPQPLACVVRDALDLRIDAVLVTSRIQARHLFQVAGDMRLHHELAAALNRHVVVGAVGPVCASSLKQLGVDVDVMPGSPNMASLITAVADYFDFTAGKE